MYSSRKTVSESKRCEIQGIGIKSENCSKDKGGVDDSKVKEAFSSYEKYLMTKDFFPQLKKDMQYKSTSKILRPPKPPGPTAALSGNKTGSAGSRGSTGTAAETRPINPTEALSGKKTGSAGSKSPPGRAAETRSIKNDEQPGGAQRTPSSSEATQNATTDTKKKVLMASNTRNDSRQETTAEKDTEKDDQNKITQELKKNLLEKEEEIKEIKEQLQTLAKDVGIQGDCPVEMIRHISRVLITAKEQTAKEQSSKEQTKSNIKELETSLDDVKKAVFRETKEKEHDIEETKERIQELHRQSQELHDLKKAVLSTEDDIQTYSTKETTEKVHALHRNVRDLESSLDEIKKAILRKSEVADKDIEKIKERIEELHRQEQELFDLKKAVLRPKNTKDKKQTLSTKETLERVNALHRNVQELESSLDEVKKVILRESKVTDKDIEKTKERIEELHRQKQELFDLKKAVLRPKDTKDEKQTFSTKETLERVNALHRNVQELESNLDEVKKAILRESKVDDKDIEKTKERIEELHRQEQELFDLKKAVLRPKDTKDEKQTLSTKETLERINALHRNVQELESSLDEVKKVILRESKVTDKDIEKTKERIEELHRQEQELFDLKKAVLRPKDTKDEKQTLSTKETLERVNALHRNVQELESSLDEVRKAILRESKVTDKDIEKTKKRIEELHRQEQELFDLKKAVLRPKDTKDEKQTLSTKETLERVNALHRNVKDLESNLKDVDKAVFGESVVKDKEHDIGKTKERIQELNRTADEYNNIIRKKEEEISDLEQQLCDSAANQQKTQENREKIERKLSDDLKTLEIEKECLLTRTADEYNNIIRKMEEEISDLKQQLRDSATKQQNMQENRQKMERKWSDDLKTLEIEKERLLTRTKDECSEWIKLAFDGELQKVASTKYLEQSQHTMENAKKLAQQLKRTADEYNNIIRKKEEEISDLERQLRDSATKQQKMQENREIIERKLNEDLKKLQIEKERLLTRLSEVAGAKPTAGYSNITDLSDSNRPTKIAEQFSELYDDLWTDVFEKLCQNSKMSNKDAIRTLLQYVEKSYARCKEISTERYRNIVAELTLWRLAMPDTETSQKKWDNTPRGKTTPTEGKEKTNFSTDDFTVNPVLSMVGLDVTNLSYIKNMLKSSAEKTSVLVEEVIWKQVAIEPSMEFVKPYVKKCVRLCWLMVAQDPRVYIKPSEEPGSKFDKDYYREFLSSGQVLDYVVWPALLLHENGPLLQKGVAQPKAKK
uniref:Early endosome antigen 1-like isoform X4 n=1 Tax=Crassostrea virginica TaxID=6565 RepID=A0A8B8D9J5_CRAVI|nr:early endosome antigen 1-like isoform X4 [Crassostrea virginica]